MNICLKGMGPRVSYIGLNSIVFFYLVFDIGRLFNVNLAGV